MLSETITLLLVTVVCVFGAPMQQMSSFSFEPKAPQQIPSDLYHLQNSENSFKRTSPDATDDSFKESTQIKSENSVSSFVGYDALSMPEFSHHGSSNDKINLWLNQNQQGQDLSSIVAAQPVKQDTMNDMLSATLKKYKVKNYLLHKLLGTSHEIEEDEGGFFSNKHLKRHGTAGVAGKVLGELIGIKIRESIEGFGKSFSEYAKDFTTRNFVNIGHVFARLLKF